MESKFAEKILSDLKSEVAKTEKVWRTLRVQPDPMESREVEPFLNAKKRLFAKAIANYSAMKLEGISETVAEAYNTLRNIEKIHVDADVDLASESVFYTFDPKAARETLQNAESQMASIRKDLATVKEYIAPIGAMTEGKARECANALKSLEDRLATENYGFGNNVFHLSEQTLTRGKALASSENIMKFGLAFSMEHAKNAKSFDALSTMLQKIQPSVDYTELSITAREGYDRTIKVLEQAPRMIEAYATTIERCVNSIKDSNQEIGFYINL
jgi:hypothetical protein